jgi:hypothetical protein
VSASATVLPAPAGRNRSIEANRAARLNRFKRERLMIDYLKRGVSVREIAVQMGVTEKRMRAIVKEALAAHMPGPPEEFVAMQISRLNEALLVAYSAMSGMNLKAVDRVVRIVHELDRYHGFFPAERRAVRDERKVEAKVEEPRRLLARRPQMAPQALEKPEPAPGDVCHTLSSRDAKSLGAPAPANDGAFCFLADPAKTPSAPDATMTAPEDETAANASDEAFNSLAVPAQAASAPVAPPIDRPEMAPQALEKARSAPEADTAPSSSDGAFASLADTAQAPSALDADLNDRPQMAPQAPEKAQSAPENYAAPNSSEYAFVLPPAASAQNPLDVGAPQVDRPETAPQAPEKAQSAPENDTAPATSDEPFLSPLAASAQDPRAYETGSIGPIEISPGNGAGAQSPRLCASSLSPGPTNPNRFNRPNVRWILNGVAAC